MAELATITDRSRQTSGRVRIGWGVIIGAVGLSCGVGAPFSSPDTAQLGLAFVGAIVVLVGVGLVVTGVATLRTHRQLGAPALSLPPAPLHLGGVVRARFERQGGTEAVAQPPTIVAELVGVEKVTYRQGSDTHTVSHESHRVPLAVTVDPTPGRVAAEIAVVVPLDAPPSLRLTNNEINWSIQVRVRTPGSPDDRGSFAVTVTPVVAPSRYGGGGATHPTPAVTP
jgi:hypothetical protein